MNIFDRRHRTEDDKASAEVRAQKQVSDEVLARVEAVLREKDRLLATAINQTGHAMRRRGVQR